MSRSNPYYPPSPRNVPDDLTIPGDDYQRRVVFVLLSLIAFAGLYSFLIFASLLLASLSPVFLPMPLGLFAAAFFFLAFLFLIKTFFKRPQADKTRRVEIDAEEHPRLFDFISRLCDETGAPFPHRIFLSRDVNACVFYNDGLLCLFMPTPKNLEIGLGLVNVLNLSEFKAVLAHEFGHFTQKSMRLHNYVYTVNRFMANIVNDRDWLDDLIFRMRNSRSRAAPVGWALYGALWLFRRGLAGCFYGINFLSVGLSREMEYHADLVAVSVSGSDAIIHALSRLEFTFEAQAAAIDDLRAATHHNMYTADLFYHQSRAAERLRRLRNNPHLGLSPLLTEGPKRTPDVFDPPDDPDAAKWDTHPHHYDREQNAKDTYVRCPTDERSPWLLFDAPEALRERVTWRFYRDEFNLGRDATLKEAAKVQAFIDAEHAETTYAPRYHGAYDDRYVEPGLLEDLVETCRMGPWKTAALSAAYARLYGRELKGRAKEYKLLREERDFLAQAEREAKGKTIESFEFRGKDYDPADAKRLLKKVERGLSAEGVELGKWDRTVFLVHYQMSREVGREVCEDLLRRYEFHLGLQKISRELSQQRAAVENVLNFLQGQAGTLSSRDFMEVRDALRKAHDALDRSLRAACNLWLPDLQNMTAGERLSDFLLSRVLIKGLKPTTGTVQRQWIGQFLRQMDEVREKVRRIHFKSLGGILALQERIAAQWTKELADAPEVEVVEEEMELSERDLTAED
jgi:Zn-dependent protease with chaperone function